MAKAMEASNATGPIKKDRRASGIPIPVKRQSSVLSNSTNGANLAGPSGSSSRSSTPVILSKPPLGHARKHSGASLNGDARGRRSSVVSNGDGRRSVDDDDPGETRGSVRRSFDWLISVHLRAQIAFLQSSLHASHQRILEMSQGVALESGSTSGRAIGRASPLLWSPKDGLTTLQEDEAVPDGTILANGFNDHSGQVEHSEPNGDGTATEPYGQIKPRLPHSNPIYDLRSRAVTPGKTDEQKLGLSRIPISAVQHALSLHVDGSPARNGLSPSSVPHTRASYPPDSPNMAAGPVHEASTALGRAIDPDGRQSPALSPRWSNGMRRSTAPTGSAASTRVIDGLQQELGTTRVALDKVKGDLRSCQRVIGSLTRQTEDLKDTRERMRVETEGLNNVISRKERLLNEVLERARSAEAQLLELQSTRKALELSTKKSLQQMTTEMNEAKSAHRKADSECVALRESVKSLREVWGRETKAVKEELKKTVDAQRKEREEARSKHLELVTLVQSQAAERKSIIDLVKQSEKQSGDLRHAFEEHMKGVRVSVEKSEEDCKAARAHAADLAGELVRLRHMMREGKSEELEAIIRSGHDLAGSLSAKPDDQAGDTSID